LGTEIERSLGLDIGDRRIGVAVSDPLGITARPLEIITRSDDTADIEALLAVIMQYQVSRVVVGLPRTLQGEVGGQAQKVLDLVARLRAKMPVPVLLRDERLSTVAAQRFRREAGREKGRGDDDIAAAVILQTYLDEISLNNSP